MKVEWSICKVDNDKVGDDRLSVVEAGEQDLASADEVEPLARMLVERAGLSWEDGELTHELDDWTWSNYDGRDPCTGVEHYVFIELDDVGQDRKILNMSEAELRPLMTSMGLDFDRAAAEGQALVERLAAEHRLASEQRARRAN